MKGPAPTIVSDKICTHCGSTYNRAIRPSGARESIFEFNTRKFCSHSCYLAWHVGTNHSAFKPEGSKRADGYVRVAVAGTRKYLHRVVVENKLGRALTSAEHVHHKDENKEHNAGGNLEILSNSGHRKLHASKQARNAEGCFV